MSVAVTAAPSRVRGLSNAGLVVVALGSLDIGLEQSLILPALPALARHYGSSLIATSWLVTGFLLSTVVAAPLLGRLGDMFGRRRLLVASLGAFTLGGLVCALASSISLVIAGRILQGFGAATGALMLGVLRDAMPGEKLTRSIGIVVGGVSAGGAVGSVLSGLLVDHISARSVFWFLTGLSLALMLGTLAFLPESRRLETVRVDGVGAALLAGGLATLLLGISKGNDWGWTSASIVGLFVASALFLLVLVLVELRVPEPLIDLALVGRRPFANANICAFAAGYSFFVVLIVVPQIAAMPKLSGYGFGYSTTRTGLLLVPMAVVSLVAAWVAGGVVDRVGPRLLMAVGSGVGIVAYALAAIAHDRPAVLALVTTGVGVTFGSTLTGIACVVVRSAARDQTSVASGVNGVLRTTGSAIATAAAAALIIGGGHVGPFPAEAGYTRAFVMGAIACTFGLVAAVLLPNRASNTVLLARVPRA